jgi:hypothetical protein
LALAKPIELVFDFARSVEVELIAAGVETGPQRNLLMETDCLLGEGHLLARPMDGASAEALLQSGRPMSSDMPRHSAPQQHPLPAPLHRKARTRDLKESGHLAQVLVRYVCEVLGQVLGLLAEQSLVTGDTVSRFAR